MESSTERSNSPCPDSVCDPEARWIGRMAFAASAKSGRRRPGTPTENEFAQRELPLVLNPTYLHPS